MKIIQLEFGQKSYRTDETPPIKSICDIEFENFNEGLVFHQKLVALVVECLENKPND